jgi:RNA polymerase sigma-70 factor, ECF subfamily
VSAPSETVLFAEETEGWPSPSEEGRVRGAPLAARGSKRAQGEIFTLVYRQMRSLAGARPEFDDLVQMAAEQAIRSLASFEGRSKLSTWTYRICYVTLLRHERWYRRWLRRFALTHRGEMPELPAEEPSDTALEQRERAARLRIAVEQLSPKRRAVLVLHDLEGHPLDAVAIIVRANPLTVRSRLRDARKDLARILSGDAYFGDEPCRPEENQP